MFFVLSGDRDLAHAAKFVATFAVEVIVAVRLIAVLAVLLIVLLLLGLASVQTKGCTKLIKAFGVFIGRRVDVLCFGNELHVLIFFYTESLKCKFECFKRTAVNDQKLVFFELNFLRCVWVENSNSCATIVQ